MKLLYVDEHLECYNYREEDKSDARLEYFKNKSEVISDLFVTEIVFVLEGGISISYERFKNETVKAGNMLLIPTGTRFVAVTESETRLLIFRVRSSIQFCEGFGLEQLFAEHYPEDDGFHTLEFNVRVDAYLNSFIPLLEDGVMCCRYHEIKIEELFLLLRAYYPKEDLAMFFRPMLSAEAEFSNFVLKHYRNVNSVQEFAALAHYSQSGFEKHFRKVFGVSPAFWLRKKKAGNLYQDLINSDKSIKQLCSEYGFSSHANMCDFCNRHFQSTPSQIRDKKNKPKKA